MTSAKPIQRGQNVDQSRLSELLVQAEQRYNIKIELPTFDYDAAILYLSLLCSVGLMLDIISVAYLARFERVTQIEPR